MQMEKKNPSFFGVFAERQSTFIFVINQTFLDTFFSHLALQLLLLLRKDVKTFREADLKDLCKQIYSINLWVFQDLLLYVGVPSLWGNTLPLLKQLNLPVDLPVKHGF